MAFLDIDGVLTPTPEWTAGISPNITPASIKALKLLKQNGFILVFITARAALEFRLKKGFEYLLKKNNLYDNSILLAANGLDQATYAHEFKMKNNQVVFKNGDAEIIKKPVIKRETFGNIDRFLLYKMLLGREIKQQLKYAGFMIKPALKEQMVSDARIVFELNNPSEEEIEKFYAEGSAIAKKQKEIFERTEKFGSPVDLSVSKIDGGIAIEPSALGKHFGVLRALKILGIMPKEKIIGFAFGDRETDRKMEIRKDIKFIKIKNNKHFAKEVKEIIKKLSS